MQRSKMSTGDMTKIPGRQQPNAVGTPCRHIGSNTLSTFDLRRKRNALAMQHLPACYVLSISDSQIWSLYVSIDSLLRGNEGSVSVAVDVRSVQLTSRYPEFGAEGGSVLASAMQIPPALIFAQPAPLCCLTVGCSVIVVHNPANGRVSIWSHFLCQKQHLVSGTRACVAHLLPLSHTD
jgi:hypothetical protein